MMVVTIVSLRVGQVTFAVSARTCWMNSKGFVFAILEYWDLYDPAAKAARFSHLPPAAPSLRWQEWRDSNPQPPVLETGALAD
jgi:hypothetical protein